MNTEKYRLAIESAAKAKHDEIEMFEHNYTGKKAIKELKTTPYGIQVSIPFVTSPSSLLGLNNAKLPMKRLSLNTKINEQQLS